MCPAQGSAKRIFQCAEAQPTVMWKKKKKKKRGSSLQILCGQQWGKHKQNCPCRRIVSFPWSPKSYKRALCSSWLMFQTSTERDFLLLYLSSCPRKVILIDLSWPELFWRNEGGSLPALLEGQCLFFVSFTTFKNTQTRLTYGWLISDVWRSEVWRLELILAMAFCAEVRTQVVYKKISFN